MRRRTCAALWLAAVAAPAWGATSTTGPRLDTEFAGSWATLRGSWQTGLPDFTGASLTVHLLPLLDVEAGLTMVLPVAMSDYARAGPRWVLYEGRDPAGTGLSLRLAALAGVRWTFAMTAAGANHGTGFNAVAALDGTWWILRHLGLTAQLVAGGTAYRAVD